MKWLVLFFAALSTASLLAQEKPSLEQQVEILNTRLGVMQGQRNAAADQAAFWEAEARRLAAEVDKLKKSEPTPAKK